MRFLLFSFGLWILVSCSREYANLQMTSPDDACWSKTTPIHLTTAWYNASVNVMSKHISGLLLIKNMPDSSQRVVFTNEAGITFFDFEFLNGHFAVHSIVPQLDKKPVILTLQKDFELLLGLPFRGSVYSRFFSGDEVYFATTQKNETAYFITSKDCASLRRLEWAKAGKRKVSVELSGSYPLPNKIELEHHTFDMQIKLTRISHE